MSKSHWKPGESANPLGMLPIPDALKNVRKMTRHESEMLIHKIIHYTQADLEGLLKNPQTPAIELMMISIVYRGIKDGDPKCLDWIMDRYLGQVVKRIRVEHEQDPNEFKTPVILTSEEKLAMLESYKKILIEKDAIDVSPKKED